MTTLELRTEVARLLAKRVELHRLGIDLPPDERLLLSRLLQRLGWTRMSRSSVRPQVKVRPRRYAGITKQGDFDSHFEAHPEDRNHALVYADFLQEQGKDAHAEVIRGHADKYQTGTSRYSYFPSEVHPHRPGDFHVEMGMGPRLPYIHLYRLSETPRTTDDEARIVERQEEEPVYRFNWWKEFPLGDENARTEFVKRLVAEGAKVHPGSYGLEPGSEEESEHMTRRPRPLRYANGEGGMTNADPEKNVVFTKVARPTKGFAPGALVSAYLPKLGKDGVHRWEYTATVPHNPQTHGDYDQLPEPHHLEWGPENGKYEGRPLPPHHLYLYGLPGGVPDTAPTDWRAGDETPHDPFSMSRVGSRPLRPFVMAKAKTPVRYAEGGRFDTHNQLIDGIRDQPQEATPRLVFADFLQENGIPGAHVVRSHASGIANGTRQPRPHVRLIPNYLHGHEEYDSSPVYAFGEGGRKESVGDYEVDLNPTHGLGTYLQVFHGSPDRQRRGVVVAVNHRKPQEGSAAVQTVTHSALARTTEELRNLLSDFPADQVRDIIRTHARWVRRPRKEVDQAAATRSKRLSRKVVVSGVKSVDTPRPIPSKKVRFAKAEKDRHPAHPLVQGMPLEHVLRHMANDPKNGGNIRDTAKHVLTSGDTTGLWALHDLLQTPEEHSYEGEHPVLKAGYKLMSAADKLHLDAKTYLALTEASNESKVGVPATHHDHFDYSPENHAIRAEWGMRKNAVRPMDRELTQRVRDRMKQLSPNSTPKDIDESIRRHATRGWGLWQETLPHRKSAAEVRESNALKHPSEILDSNEFKEMNKATRYRRSSTALRRGAKVVRYVTRPQDLLTELQKPEYGPHMAGLDDPLGGLRGVAADHMDEQGRHEEANLLRSPGHIEVRADGTVKPSFMERQGIPRVYGGPEVREQFAKPSYSWSDEPGNEHHSFVYHFAVPHGDGTGHWTIMDGEGLEQGDADRIHPRYRDYPRTEDLLHFTAEHHDMTPAEVAYMHHHATTPQFRLSRKGKTKRYTMDINETIRQNLSASRRQQRGQGYVQDTTAGGVLADALDEAGEPHGEFFRNLVHGANGFDYEHRTGSYREYLNNPHPLRNGIIDIGVNWSTRPVGNGSGGPATAMVVHRRIPGGGSQYILSHDAVLKAPALREWAAHPKVSEALRKHLTNAANYLEAQEAASASAPPDPSTTDEHGRPMGRRGLPKKYALANRSDFLAALRRIRSSNQRALHQTATHVARSLGLDPVKIFDALHDTPHGSVPGVAQAVFGNAAPEAVHSAAAWMGLTGNLPGVAVFHPRPTGPDMLYRMRHVGSGMDLRARLDRFGIKSRIIIPHKTGFDVLIPDKGGVLGEAVERFADHHKLTLEASPGHFSVVGSADQAKAREMYRGTVSKQEKMTRRGSPRRYMEHTHSEFHQKIAENPKDKTASLVYADYVQEGGKPNIAEFIRHSVTSPANNNPAYGDNPSYLEHWEGAPLEPGEMKMSMTRDRLKRKDIAHLTVRVGSGIPGKEVATWYLLNQPLTTASAWLRRLKQDGLKPENF